MYRYLKLSIVLFALYTANGVAQTTVTNANNGTTNAIPKYNGTASLTNSAIVDSSGSIGIGTATPAYKLDVSGDINVGSGQAYRINGTKVVTALPSLTSFFFGGAGNATMTGSYNTAVGFFALANNTTGHNNAVTGESALQFNTTGYYNTATGTNALYTNTSGYLNNATGEHSLFSNTTGYQNNAYGYGALYNMTTGYGNVAMGHLAGSSIASSGLNQTSIYSVYIGSSSTALADGDTNEVVIGSGAGGNGSNSVTLGNTSITKTVLRGNVGIGTTSPNELLEIGSTGSTGGRMFVSNGGGTSRKGLLFTSPNPSSSFGRIESYDYGASAGMPLVINNVGGGNVGIGTTSPGSKLEVNGGIKLTLGSGGGISFADGTTQNTAFPVAVSGGVASYTGGLNVSGKVGIGTTSPTGPLDVYVAGNTSTSTPSIWIGDGTSFSSPASTGANGLVGFRGNGWLNGFLGFYPHQADGGAYFRLTGESSSYGDFPAGLLVTGNVGIGTGSPSSPLEINGNGSVTGGITLDNVTNLPYNHNQIYSGTTNANAFNIHFGDNVVGDGYKMNFQVGADSTLTNAMTLQDNGNVGIGTSTPGEKLEVSGRIKVSGAGQIVFAADNSVQSTAWTGTLTGGDYAESMDVTGSREQYEPGDVLALDPDHPEHVVKASERYTTLVAGVYSTKPGVVGRRQTSDKASSTTEVPMAMVGVVPTKVSTENGPIRTGDLLVVSSTAGYAMKGTDRSQMLGAVIGKAMGSLDSGTGVIEALISLQ